MGKRARGPPSSFRWTTLPSPTLGLPALFSLASLLGWVILFSAQEMPLS